MDHMSVQEFWRAKVQLSRQQRSSYSKIPSKISIRPRLNTTQSKAAGGPSFVSCTNGVQLGVVLALFCLLHSADSFSLSSCVEFRRGATEHTVQAGGQKFSCHHDGLAPENENSYSGSESSWSCIDLETSTPRKPFFLQSRLQSISLHGRSHASTARHAQMLSTSSLRKFKERLCDKLRMRKFGPVGNHDNAKVEWWTEVVPGVHAQDSVVVDIETTCSKDHTLASVSFSKMIVDQKNLPLEVASSPYRCNNTLTAPTTKQTGASASAAASETRDSTDSATSSLHFHVRFNTGTNLTPAVSRLLQILEEVEDHLRATSCNGDGDGPQSEARRRMTVRRSLLTRRSLKPVIITDSVVVVIGFILAVSALSCWVRQRRALAVKSDAAFALPVMTPSNPVVSLVTGSEQNPSPRSGSGPTITGPGRLAPVEEGQGRWERAEAEGRAREPAVEEESPGCSGRWERVERAGRIREPEGEEDRPGRWETVEEEVQVLQEDENSTGSGQPVTEESPGNRQRVEVLEEEGPGRRSRGAGQGGSLLSTRKAEGETTTATATATAQTARYRAEPFCFQALAAATGDFDESNQLGSGSFGTVYRGLLCDGRVVAIKRADRNNMLKLIDKQCAFKAELDVMSRLHHKHLVNLVGYCDHGDEMMLVYEYMSNGTLADHLHNKHFKSRSLSSWKIRIRVALQAARGIEYLHTYAEPPVIHRDIKPSNLLLDAEGSVRVSDFGLCLIFPTASEDDEEELQHVSTNAAGTMGYMDPEYYHHRHLTTKSDVYSFGIVILELLTGERAIHRRDNSHVSVVDYAVPAIQAGELARIVDPCVRVPTGREFAAMKVMAEVGCQAVRLWGKDRPGMTEIVRQLEQAVTLCRTRHAPLPDFGAQIGSSTDPSYSSSPPSHPSGDSPVAAFHLDPAAPALLDKFVGSVEEEEEEAEGTTETDVAQLGLVDVTQVGSVSTSQACHLKDFLRDIRLKIQTTHDDDDDDDSFELGDKSDVNLELYRNYAQHNLLGWSLARATASASASGSNHAMDTASSLSSAAAGQAAVYHGGGKCSEPHPSSRWKRSSEHRETLHQELRDSWWRSQLSKRVKLGPGSGVFDTFPKEESFNSCEGGSIAASTTGVDLDYYSRKVVDDSSLDQCATISAEFSNLNGDLGPPKHVHPPPPPPPEPNHGSGPLAVVAGKDQGREFSNCATGDIDIESVLDEYSGEQAIKSTSYAGFSDFSVLHHDLDEMMRALHCLQEQQEQFKSCRNESGNSIQGQNQYQGNNMI